MAGCLKITDPRALTLAYKLPLKKQECEWCSWVGGMEACRDIFWYSRDF